MNIMSNNNFPVFISFLTVGIFVNHPYFYVPFQEQEKTKLNA